MMNDEIAKLFSLDTHFQVQAPRGKKGTGIDLLLHEELVEFNGGKLKIRSTLDKGSVFYFNLPLIKGLRLTNL